MVPSCRLGIDFALSGKGLATTSWIVSGKELNRGLSTWELPSSRGLCSARRGLALRAPALTTLVLSATESRQGTVGYDHYHNRDIA